MPSGILFNSSLLIALAAIIPSLALGILVYSQAEQSASRRVFALCSAATIFWALVNYFSVQSLAFPLFWIRLVLFFAVFHSFTFFLLVHVFPEQYFPSQKKPLLWGMAGVSLLTMAATVSTFVFKALSYAGGKAVPVPGPLIPLFALTILALFI